MTFYASYYFIEDFITGIRGDKHYDAVFISSAKDPNSPPNCAPSDTLYVLSAVAGPTNYNVVHSWIAKGLTRDQAAHFLPLLRETLSIEGLPWVFGIKSITGPVGMGQLKGLEDEDRDANNGGRTAEGGDTPPEA